MILTLDVGNTQVYGGVFEGERLRLQFRRGARGGSSSDEYGLFLRSVLNENGVDPREIRQVAACSVVPDVVHSVRSACIKYFDLQPFFLQAGVKTGLRIRYRNPLEVGSDRIANAIAGMHLHPDQNLIIADLGTATTLCVVTADRNYLGGVILPGLRISMEALESRTAKLPVVEIVAAEELVGRSTVESIQAGLYYGHLYALRGLFEGIRSRYFGDQQVRILGTGGFSRIFEKDRLFDETVPELVHLGLYRALRMNGG